MPIGTNVEGKMVAALRRLGFDKVFDTDFGADLTIMEEANEFIERVQNGGMLPMITSCSPGWVKYCEHYYPEYDPQSVHLQVARSRCSAPWPRPGMPRRWASIPRTSCVVSVMPCTAKKFEIGRDDADARQGVPDVDIAITTRELARMIKRAGIHFTRPARRGV